jgi:hypothetical protein
MANPKKRGFLANQRPTEIEREQIEGEMRGVSNSKGSNVVLGTVEIEITPRERARLNSVRNWFAQSRQTKVRLRGPLPKTGNVFKK